MTKPLNPINHLRECRAAAGLTQAQLADRAGISRTAVTAIEARRALPSVAAALALAKALDTTVEAIFARSEAAGPPAAWACEAPGEPRPYWEAEVGGNRWLYRADASPMLTPLPDGVVTTPSRAQASTLTRAPETLVVAGCDPAAGLLASEYANATGMRMLVIPRSSRQALDLLQQRKVHAAGLHLSTPEQPERNAQVVRDSLGSDFQLLRIARWQEGIASAPALRIRSARAALKSKLRWIGREPGSGARQCLDRLLRNHPPPRRNARDHRGVAAAIQNGWADAGICVQLTCDEAHLQFLPLQEEPYDLCIPQAMRDDRRVKALLRVVRSKTYRTLLGQLPGYNTHDTGGLERVS
jgi:molybdate-binding protein/DNA-binding XRE family transcriptional regulator